MYIKIVLLILNLLLGILGYTENINKNEGYINLTNYFNDYTKLYYQNISTDDLSYNPTETNTSGTYLTKVYYKKKATEYKSFISFNIYNFQEWSQMDGFFKDNSLQPESIIKELYSKFTYVIALDKTIKKANIEIKNNNCIYFVPFFTEDPDITADYYSQYGVAEFNIYDDDDQLRNFFLNYNRTNDDKNLTIENKLTTTQNKVYLKILCPFMKLYTSNSSKLLVTFEKEQDNTNTGGDNNGGDNTGGDNNNGGDNSGGNNGGNNNNGETVTITGRSKYLYNS